MDVAQALAQFAPHLGVKRAKRFVQQQHPRLDRKGAGQGHALALAARQLRGISRGDVGQLDQVQQLGHAAVNLGLGRALAAGAGAKTISDVVEHRHVPEQRIALEHEARPAVLDRHAGRVLAVEQHPSRGRKLQPPEDPQQRGLARPRRTQKRDKGARWDVQGHGTQRGRGAEGLGDFVDVDMHDRFPFNGDEWRQAGRRGAVPAGFSEAGSQGQARSAARPC